MRYDPRISELTRPLTRRQEEDIADAVFKKHGLLTFFCRTAADDKFWTPTDTGLDLVVTAADPREARHVWERWALDVKGAEGKVRILVTFTPPAQWPKRPREEEAGYEIDLDRLAFEDEYAAAADLETSPFRI
jgi:hypothetical protein